MTTAKFSHLPADDFARRNNFNENPPITHWYACSFSPKNSVRFFFFSPDAPSWVSLSTGTRLQCRSMATSSTFRKRKSRWLWVSQAWPDRMNKQLETTRSENTTAGRFVGLIANCYSRNESPAPLRGFWGFKVIWRQEITKIDWIWN